MNNKAISKATLTPLRNVQSHEREKKQLFLLHLGVRKLKSWMRYFICNKTEGIWWVEGS